jgi:hypothetical protein
VVSQVEAGDEEEQPDEGRHVLYEFIAVLEYRVEQQGLLVPLKLTRAVGESMHHERE